MEILDQTIVKKLFKSSKISHKGQNGKLTIIGGSKLFHGASLWALKTASRIVDMVFYASTQENNACTRRLNQELYDFICVAREDIESYIEESDAILIGPGMARKDQRSKIKDKNEKLTKREWEEDTYKITEYLLKKYPHKKWIIDAGALQMMDVEWLKGLEQVIITPHQKEFEELFKIYDLRSKIYDNKNKITKDFINIMGTKAKEYNCVIVLKGPTDIICSPNNCLINQTGNEGMTKGGTGDVLAGLIAGLACKNDLFLASCAGTYINGLAGDELYKTVGPYFNASDLCDQIPKTMWRLIKSALFDTRPRAR